MVSPHLSSHKTIHALPEISVLLHKSADSSKVPQVQKGRLGSDLVHLHVTTSAALCHSREIPVTEKTQANRFSSPIHLEDTAALPHWKYETLVLSFSMVLC